MSCKTPLDMGNGPDGRETLNPMGDGPDIKGHRGLRAADMRRTQCMPSGGFRSPKGLYSRPLCKRLYKSVFVASFDSLFPVEGLALAELAQARTCNPQSGSIGGLNTLLVQQSVTQAHDRMLLASFLDHHFKMNKTYT